MDINLKFTIRSFLKAIKASLVLAVMIMWYVPVSNALDLGKLQAHAGHDHTESPHAETTITTQSLVSEEIPPEAVSEPVENNIIDESEMEPLTELLTIPNEYAIGKVERITTGTTGTEYVNVRLSEGSAKGKLLKIPFDFSAGLPLQVGDDIIVGLNTEGGTLQATIIDMYRFPGILFALVIFVALAILIGRKKGGFSLGGLLLTLIVLIAVIIPLIVAGWNPFWVSFGGVVLIAVASLYLSHGFHTRTTLALISTLVTLIVAAFGGIFFAWIARLTGMGTEETMLLQLNTTTPIDLKGLLLGGIMLGALGVLDDITTSQTAAVEEIHNANKSLSFSELFRRGLSVGREHIASLINTLFLAYAGASFPLLLLLSTANNEPLWVTLNHEYMVEEIVRTLAGSVALIVAVPFTTWLAAYVFTKRKAASEVTT